MSVLESLTILELCIKDVIEHIERTAERKKRNIKSSNPRRKSDKQIC